MSQAETGPRPWGASGQPEEQAEQPADRNQPAAAGRSAGQARPEQQGDQGGQPPSAHESAERPGEDTPEHSGDDSGDDSAEQGAAEEPEAIQEPAKLIRLARMTRQLLDESREATLDEHTLERLRTHVATTATELGEVLSTDLRDELTRLRTGWTEQGGVSQAELRVEQAQLIGWLEGILQGIHNALAQEQGGAQQGGSGQMPTQSMPGQPRGGHQGPEQPGAGQLGGAFGSR